MKSIKMLPSLLVAFSSGLIQPATSTAAPATASTTSAEHTKTLDNLQLAYQGEANATHKYELFAKKAQQEGYAQVAKLFRAIAFSESVHRDNHKAVIIKLGGQPEAVRINQVEVKTTRKNLKGPIESERNESSEMYPEYLSQAEQDGLPEAFRSFAYARDAEIKHLALLQKALSELGHNPPTDYYVSRTSGDIITIEPREYVRVD